MSARRLLYLDSHHLSAYVWWQGRLRLEDSFVASDSGLFAFSAYLAEHGDSDFAMLVNMAEEEQILETIPFLQGGDRKALIARKLAQHFMGSPFAAAFSLGFEKNRRKNEKLLLAALTNPAPVEPWLKCIAEARAPLSGIYTVAQLGSQLLKKLGGNHQGCILLTMQDHSIRESYLKDGFTLFSRIAPINDSSTAGIARSFAAEASKLHQYLVGQRLISRDTRLPALIVAAPTAVPITEAACAEQENLDFAIVDSHLAASKLGLKTLPEDNRCDLLYLQLLAAAPPRQQFAAASYRRDHLLARLRQGIIGVGVVALLGGLLFASHEAWTAHALRQEAADLEAGGSELEARYNEIAATFPHLGIDQILLDNETLRRLSDRYATLNQPHHPDPALRHLGRILDQTPAIILDRLDWRVGPAPTDKAAPPDASNNAANDAANDAALDNHDETLVIYAHVQSAPTASARQVLASFNAFVERLRQDPDSRVRILQQPFDLESERPLRGGDNGKGSSEGSQAKPFTVEIQWLKKP